LSTDAHSTDTSLEGSTAQMHSSTCSTLYSSTVTISLYSAITTCSPLRATHRLTVTTVRLSAGLKCCLLHFWILLLSSSQCWLPLTRSFCSFLTGKVSCIPALLKSEASWIATLLVAVALSYNILWVFRLLSFYTECASSSIVVRTHAPSPFSFRFHNLCTDQVGKDCEDAW
jgi:hypothetical protein